MSLTLKKKARARLRNRQLPIRLGQVCAGGETGVSGAESLGATRGLDYADVDGMPQSIGPGARLGAAIVGVVNEGHPSHPLESVIDCKAEHQNAEGEEDAGHLGSPNCADRMAQECDDLAPVTGPDVQQRVSCVRPHPEKEEVEKVHAAFSRYDAMNSRTFASVSGQSLRGRLSGVPRSSYTKRQSLAASRPNVLGAI